MPATIVWGKNLHIVESSLADGSVERQVVGSEGGSDFMSWSSVGRIEEIAQRHGIQKHSWPIYRDCEIESEVPLADVQARSEALRGALESIPAAVIEGDHWLNFFTQLLREGHSFLIMV